MTPLRGDPAKFSLAFQGIGHPYNNLTAKDGNLTLNPDELSFVVAPTEPVRGRSCGSCTLCCKVLGVPALDKPKGAWCTHCEKGVGCRIYERRPDACRSFLCGWLINPRFDAEWKPERSKIVIAVAPDGNGLVFHCDPGFPQAWRKEPYVRRNPALGLPGGSQRWNDPGLRRAQNDHRHAGTGIPGWRGRRRRGNHSRIFGEAARRSPRGLDRAAV